MAVADYAILTLPSANRVYGAAAATLARAEVHMVGSTLAQAPAGIRVDTMGGVEYLRFSTPEPLDAGDRAAIANLSATYALFAVDAAGHLEPLPVDPTAVFDSDLVTIQRYPGKTNEQFTHLLVNVAVAASDAARRRDGRRLRLLDPLCGRGTTLNRALLYGFDVAGIELNGKDVEAYRTFLVTYLRDHRVKHKVEDATIRRGDGKGAKRFVVAIEPGGRDLRVECVRDDTTRAAVHFPTASFDVIATDLPYGIQHGATAGQALARSPIDLLRAALPAWVTVLRRGGSMALAWNLRTAPRPAVEAELVNAGLAVLPPPFDDAFVHRVDRTITRDLVVARRG